MEHTKNTLLGIHHITAITSSAADNLAFYSQVLGMRLVKQTVNFDDPYTYHLYYGDAAGTPGTILTFFPWEQLPPGKPGAGMITAVAFAIAEDAVTFWLARLRDYQVDVQRAERFGAPVLRFKDPHGLGLELIASHRPAAVSSWPGSPVPAGKAVQGFHSATQVTRRIESTQSVLVEMGLMLEGHEGQRSRFRLPHGNGPGLVYDLLADAGAPEGLQGAGSVHHIAFRTPTDAAQMAWQSLLRQKGLSVTPVRDRSYFRSIYFHEPGGALFEIATDGPGFAIDEAPEHLGRALKLPPQYETMRKAIERHLPPLQQVRPADRHYV